MEDKKFEYFDTKEAFTTIFRDRVLALQSVKSLCRFRLVNKEWGSKITSGSFNRTYSESFKCVSGFYYQSENGPSFLPICSSSGVSDASLSFLPEPVEVLYSSCGLLCCRAVTTRQNRYYICNPGLRQWIELPPPNEDHGPDPAVMLYQPDCEKIWLTCAVKIEVGYRMELYESTKGSWRGAGDTYSSRVRILPKTGIFLNGRVYWLKEIGLVSFDLVEEKWYTHVSTSWPVLGTLDGMLCSARLDQRSLCLQTMEVKTERMLYWKGLPATVLDFPVREEYSSYYTWNALDDDQPGGIKFMGKSSVLILNDNCFYCNIDGSSKCLGERYDMVSRTRYVAHVNCLTRLGSG